jgi:collagen type VI alpha
VRCAVVGGGESLCRGPLDLALLVDSSGSLQERGDYFPIIKEYLKQLVDYFDVPNVRIGIIVYSNFAMTFVHFDNNLSKDELKNRIDDLPFMGSLTGIADALIAAETELYTTQRGDRVDVPDVVMLITDGTANHNVEMTMPAAQTLRNHATIVAVGVDDLVNRTELMLISGSSQNTVILQTFNDLVPSTRNIAELLCQDDIDLVTTTPSPTTGPPLYFHNPFSILSFHCQGSTLIC